MNSCIITLDIINEICNKKGKIAKFADRIEHIDLINKVNDITKWGRNNNILIAHVKVGFNKNYKDSSIVSPILSAAKQHNALNLAEWGCNFCENLVIKDDDMTVIKHRVSAFYGTDLDVILRANKIEHLILCGVATNNAVELTAREAHDRDYKVTIISDATETNNDYEQEASLTFLRKISTVIKCEDFLQT